jgi:transcription initiation factor TFIIIB Brf1 subunit/transcription initiation factor TFIIB
MLNGDRVCRRCGLVVESHIIDDRAVFDVNRNLDYYPVETTKLCEEVEMVLNYLRVDSAVVESTIQNIIQDQKSKSYNGCWNTLWAYATTEAFRLCGMCSISPEIVCSLYGVEQSKLKIFEKTEEKSKICDVPIQQRIVKHANTVVDSSEDMSSVKRRAIELEKILRKNPKYLSKRPSKMDVVILYYILSEEKGQKLDKKKYYEECNVSVTTFNNHLKLVRKLLSATT